ncbi:unnamed protein product, partial [Soboliphyme baturini]|uniref:CALU protein n=1 Tax=Soboliphyme baturini TaxID=241478 RepID=A0A183ICP6_9BILA
EKIGDEEHFKDGVHNPEYDRQAFLGEEEAKKYKELTPEQSKERLAKLLVRMDKDNDGFLNEQELKDHIAYMNKRYISKDVERNWAHYKKETMEDMDKNGDGFVDLEEYINDLYRPQDYPDQKTEPDWVASERTMFKQYRDKNGDGKMDAEEMRNWLMPPGFDNVEAEANHLLHLSDDNKDGKLSKEEVLTHYEVFVGSQATDYGEQLHTHDPSEL